MCIRRVHSLAGAKTNTAFFNSRGGGCCEKEGGGLQEKEGGKRKNGERDRGGGGQPYIS